LTTLIDKSFPPPIVVMAAPGLPAPTIAAALGQGPRTYGLPELNLELMPTVDVLQSELTGLRMSQIHGLLRAIAQVHAGEQTMLSIEMARRWLSRRIHLNTEEVAREFAARLAPRRLVLPATAALLDREAMGRLRRAFPEATWVHLTLHPWRYGQLLMAGPAGEAILQVTGAMDEATEPPTPDPQILWMMAERGAATLPSEEVLRVPLDALAADPVAMVRGLAGRLGLPDDEAAAARMARPEASPFAGIGPMGAHARSPIQPLPDVAAALVAPSEPRLTGPLPWRPDGEEFRAEVRERAAELGYA
jgi:hypothetical protein